MKLGRTGEFDTKVKNKTFTYERSKFPLPHVVLEDKKEVWIRCTSAITAMGISAMMDRHFPGTKDTSHQSLTLRN